MPDWAVAAATAGAILALLYGGALVAVAWFSAHPPRVPPFVSPGFLGRPQENVELTAADGTPLRAWWTAPAAPRLVVVYAHGYLMNRCEPVGLAHRLFDHGAAGLLVDLRAQGGSGGRRVGMGVAEAADVAAAVRWARARCPGVPVVLWGSSMGGAACLFALAADPALADGIVVDSAYGRLTVAMAGWWGFFVGPRAAPWLAPANRLASALLPRPARTIDTAAAAAEVRVPMLLLYGDADPLVPPAEVERLRAAAGGPVELAWFAGRGHSEARWHEPARYFAVLEDWLVRCRWFAGDDRG